MNAIARLDSQIAELQSNIETLENKKIKLRKNQSFKCGCGVSHQFKNCVVVRTHWYVQPYSCSGGDYWNEGKFHIICPDTGNHNRMLFDTYDVEWSERKKYENDPEEQFRRLYIWTKCFKAVEEMHDDKQYSFWNNYHLDKNRKRYSLVEKKKKDNGKAKN